MDSVNTFMGENTLADHAGQLRIGRCTQQGINRLFGNGNTAVQDEDGNSQTNITIDLPTPDHGTDAGEKNGQCGDHIIAAVGGGGLQCGGMYGFAQLSAEYRKPQLYGNGC